MTDTTRNFRHGRCEATSKQSGERCKQPATDSRGKCYWHGGATPLTHGIYSDVVREEDQAVLDALEDISTAQKLEETLNLQIMKLRRAVGLLDDPDREADFWATFEDLVAAADSPEGLDAATVKNLANMLDVPHRAQRDLMDLIRRTAKTLHDVTEGQDINVSHDHDVDADDLDALRETIQQAYGTGEN